MDSRQIGVAHVGGTEAGDATRRRIGQLLPVVGDLVAPGVGDVDDLVAVAGITDITIGETLADPEDPRALPVITVDEP
ncbi:MAG: translational GTPase TypA, partial [Acidimicrobiia bacterium]|nr:translational GTPase TypA [Acidimicrobiia bacterium]